MFPWPFLRFLSSLIFNKTTTLTQSQPKQLTLFLAFVCKEKIVIADIVTQAIEILKCHTDKSAAIHYDLCSPKISLYHSMNI